MSPSKVVAKLIRRPTSSLLWNSPLKSATRSEEMMANGVVGTCPLCQKKKASLPASSWLVYAELQKQHRARPLLTCRTPYKLAQTQTEFHPVVLALTETHQGVLQPGSCLGSEHSLVRSQGGQRKGFIPPA